MLEKYVGKYVEKCLGEYLEKIFRENDSRKTG